MTERRIHTRVVFQWNEHKNRYDIVDDINYLYVGPVALAGSQPVREWTDWAFYDDGTESGSIIIGSKNTDPTLVVDTIYFFRAGIEETGNNKWNNAKARLEYNHNAGGWNEVTTTSSVVQAADSANVADDDTTTQRITSFSFIPSNAGVSETGRHDEGIDPQNNGIEVLYVITIVDADVSQDDTIELRLWDYINGAFEFVNQTNPTITVNKSAGTTFFESFNETWQRTESLVKSVDKVLSETWQRSETLVNKISTSFSETWIAAETLAKKMFQSFSETWSAAEALITKFAVLFSINETWSASESMTKTVKVVVGETWNAAEALVKKVSVIFAETWDAVESLTKKVATSFAETWDATEAIITAFVVKENFAETWLANETLAEVFKAASPADAAMGLLRRIFSKQS